MKVERKSTALALVTGAALVLSACGGDSEAEESATVPEPLGASASESTAATSQPPAYPTSKDPEHYAVAGGGYMLSLPDGTVCSIEGELNDRIGSDFACLFTFGEPMQTEDGEPTKGLEYRDTMFVPSAALTDPDLQSDFTAAGAESMDPGTTLALGDYVITTETQDETAIENDVTGGSFFVAEQQVTRFWTPRPDWVPEPDFPPIN